MTDEEYKTALKHARDLQKKSPAEIRKKLVNAEIIDEEGIYTKHYPHLRAALLADLEEAA